MKYVRRGSWRVLDRDKFLNITIEIFHEFYVFLFELNQVRQCPSVWVFVLFNSESRVLHILIWELGTNFSRERTLSQHEEILNRTRLIARKKDS
jgi:hypothetical protein